MTTTTRNIIEELKRDAAEQGAGEAVRTIAGPALETWMRALDGKDADPERLDDPHIRPDETRLARAVREACAMADRARKHGGPVAQPYALAAYLAWWDGDGKAATLAALAALDDDPETSLAIMVATMAASGRYPAYLR